MTVFNWTASAPNPDDSNSDEFNTFWFTPTASCALCGEPLRHGERVMAWRAETDLVLHAACVKTHATGLLKDIAECLR